MLDEIAERQHGPFLMQMIECKRKMAKSDLQNSLIVVAGLVPVAFMLPAGGVEAGPVKPFWTGKSSTIEGNYLYGVGIASNTPMIEAGRKRVYKNCSDQRIRCSDQGCVSNYNRMSILK